MTRNLTRKSKWLDVMSDLRLRIFVVLVFCIFISIGVPFIRFMTVPEEDGTSVCQMEHELRINCLPGISTTDQTKEICEALGCCWDEFGVPVPSCYHSSPTQYTYKLDEKRDDTEFVLSTDFNTTPLGHNAASKIIVAIEKWSGEHLRVVIRKIGSLVNPLMDCLSYNASKNKETAQYDVQVEELPQFHVKVYRRTGRSMDYNSIPIFNTFYGPLIVSDDFTEVTSLLPSYNIYGIGQSPKLRFRHDLKYPNTYALFSTMEYLNASNPGIYMNAGVHPFYMVVEEDGKAHGVLLLSSSPMEVVISGAPIVTFRSMEPLLDFHIFVGPKPADVIRQLSELVGKPSMPPFWSLGYHSCKENSDLRESMDYLSFTVSKRIPHESDCGLSHLSSLNLEQKQLSETFLRLLKSSNRKLTMFRSPHVSLDDADVVYNQIEDSFSPGEKFQDVYVKDSTAGNTFVGSLPNEIKVVYPDYFHPNISVWLSQKISSLTESFEFDALFLDKNTPLNFNFTEDHGAVCGGNTARLFSSLDVNLNAGTICMNATHTNGVKHLYLHNIYGHMQMIKEKSAFQSMASFGDRRKFIVSLSTFVGSGAIGGQWAGLVPASWKSLKHALIQMLDFSLFAIPMNGVPICGTSGPVNTDLCSRWIQLAAFQPMLLMYRTDSKDVFTKNRMLTAVAKNMLQLRYSLLPYLYTLFYNANQYGATVVRPLFFEFPRTPETYEIDEQFMWGSGLLISPVLRPSTQKIQAFFPPGCWYDYYTGKKEVDTEYGTYKELMALEYHVNLHIRGGQVVPSQESGLTTTSTRKKGFILSIALNSCDHPPIEKDSSYQAYGEIYIDDGISQNAVVDENYLLVTIHTTKYNITIQPKFDGLSLFQNAISTMLNVIHIYGVFEKPSHFLVDTFLHGHVYNRVLGTVTLKDMNLDLHSAHTIFWESV